jgi:hypothetical protein
LRGWEAEGGGGVGGKGGGGKGEMTQALYAHMNNKTMKRKKGYRASRGLPHELKHK